MTQWFLKFDLSIISLFLKRAFDKCLIQILPIAKTVNATFYN